MEPDVPLAAARSLMVDPEADEFGIANVFLDGSPPSHSSTELHLETAVPRLPYSHWTSSSNRYSLTAASLYIETNEGTPVERLVVLGWMINTRQLLISLPTDEFTA